MDWSMMGRHAVDAVAADQNKTVEIGVDSYPRVSTIIAEIRLLSDANGLHAGHKFSIQKLEVDDIFINL